jgi:hypothetical protein
MTRRKESAPTGPRDDARLLALFALDLEDIDLAAATLGVSKRAFLDVAYRRASLTNRERVAVALDRLGDRMAILARAHRWVRRHRRYFKRVLS